MVCLGNICRSTLAEGILKSKVDSSRVFVDSAGTGDYHIGEPPDKRSIAIAKINDIDISGQRGRQFTQVDFEKFDHIFVMDASNRENIMKMAKTETDRKKIHLILDELFPDENVDVPDPYFGGTFEFENVYKMLDEACEKIAQRL